MRTGNVIRDPSGGMWIVVEVHDYGDPSCVEAVSFDSENCSAMQRLDDHEKEITCHCGDFPELDGQPQADCEDCHGTGSYVVKVKGWKRSKILAPTVKDFLLRGIKRQFKLE